MKMERQAAMVKSVAKSIKQKERKESKSEKLRDQMYSILKNKNKALDEIQKEDLTKKEYLTLVEFIEKVLGMSIQLYPNLK